MKKLFVLFLVLGMVFSLTACGGNDNDANNAAIQAKIDEALSLSDQFVNWYKDNGFLEGEDAAVIQPVVDQMTKQMEDVKAAHQKNLDAGGYSDDILDGKLQALDKIITGLKAGIEGQAAYVAPAETGTELETLTEKYNTVVGLVNEASAKATENGWEAYEAFNSELNATIAVLEVVGADLENPDTMDVEYMITLITEFDTMILTWQDYLTQVSEPYVAD